MRVGLSLLTLVPGISGGSETYARELARALARIGTHEYVGTRAATRSRCGGRARHGRRRALPELDDNDREAARDGWRNPAARHTCDRSSATSTSSTIR